MTTATQETDIEAGASQRTQPLAGGMAYLALAVAGCFWGTGFYFSKVALTEMSVGHMLFYRFTFGCIPLLPLLWKYHAMPRRDDILLFFISAAAYIPIQFLIQFQGVARTTVSHASLMVGTLPLILAGAAVIFTHERLDRLGWLTLVGSTAGAGLIVFQAHSTTSASGGPSLVGDLLVLVSLFSGVAWVLVTQRMMHKGHKYSAIVLSIYILFLGTVMLDTFVLVTDGLPPVALSRSIWLSLLALGLLPTTFATLLWNWGLERVPAARAGVFINFEPVIGTILGVTLLHESLGPAAALGGALIVGAAIVFSLRGKSSQAAA
jgi:drug/metabolite transporter (DMT)-like permease